ncbi:MAG: formylglycine-generating enzyme family protein [Candidatus Hinthialibacter antarcticus]|nr:formylglycine-generating enzyme family protein [Candidatus Hinthialibacter antarcticus]
MKLNTPIVAIGCLLILCACQTAQRTGGRSSAPPKEKIVELPGLSQDAAPLVLARIPAGSFLMGSDSSEPGHEDNEAPQHEVVISEDFYMGKFEITQAQWVAIMGSNPSHEEMIGDNLPVNKVSLDECQEFLKRLNGMLNDWRYRLPTEAEWEYACRAGSKTTTSFSKNPTPEQIDKHAWYRENSDYVIHPVGFKTPNAWGLHDMYGNVWEWCWDWYGPYSPIKRTDPRGPSEGEEIVIRGGSWMAKPEFIRSADRGKMDDSRGYHTGGFRIVWSETCVDC